MKEIAKYSFILTFVWTGFILAISFMEAWVKFRAPSISLAEGLDVGRQVFHALSVVEKGFIVLQVIAVFFYLNHSPKLYVLGGIIVILLVQWVWILPVLDARAASYIAGVSPEGKSPHFYFVGLEVLKVGLLTALGYFQLKEFKLTLS